MQLSKKLSWLLRHGAVKEGLPLGPDGFLPVSAVLTHKHFVRDFNFEVLQRIVDSDEKGRFTLRRHPLSNEYQIRANQGHTIAGVISEECMERIENSNDVPMAVHGTFYRYWPSILSEGLRRFQRNHIHFCASDQMHIHGGKLRGGSQILIYLDVKKAMEEGGMQFYRSDNDIILCAGNQFGRINKEFFAKVVDRRTGKSIDF